MPDSWAIDQLFPIMPIHRLDEEPECRGILGLLSLSRCYTVPTQLILALGAVFLVLSARRGSSSLPPFNVPCIARVFGVEILLLLATLVFLRVMMQGGRT